MNIGKTLFAQLMDFLPWSTFARIVARYDGDARVRTLRCAEQYRAMAFAQLTYRESLRDIEVCLSAQAVEALPHGLSRTGAAIDAGRCQRDARLAHLRGVRPPADCPGEEALRRRQLGLGVDQHGLCSGLHHHRSVPVAVSVGALSLHQGGGEDAHAARSARQHPELHPHLGRQAARRSRPRPAAARSGRHLRHGSRLCRLRAPLRVASGWRLLRHPRQIEPAMPTASTPRRPIGRPASLPTRPSRWMATPPARTIPVHLRRIRFKDPGSRERRWCS